MELRPAERPEVAEASQVPLPASQVELLPGLEWALWRVALGEIAPLRWSPGATPGPQAPSTMGLPQLPR